MRDPHRDHPLPTLTRRVTPWAAALVIVVTAAAALAQTAPARHEVTLSEALREIAAHSAAAVTAGLDLESVRELTTRARASYYPTVVVSAGHVNRDHPVVAVFGALEAPTTQASFFTGELNVSQLLWDGGRRSAAVKATEHLASSTARQGEADVRGVQFQGLRTYLEALSLRAQRHVVEERMASLQEHLRVAQDLYDHGVVARNDLLQTDLRLRLVKDQAAQLDDAEATALQKLNRLMGRSPDAPLALASSVGAPPPMPFTQTELAVRTTDANRQLLALRARLKAEEAALSFQRAEDYPTVVAEASHTYEENRYLLYRNANSVFLGISWKAYDGGVRRANQRETDIAIAKTRQQLTDLRRELAIVVDQAYRGYQQALREAATAETNITAAEENLRIEEDQYKAGLARTTEVLDAESVLAESRFALVAQHYNAYLQQGALVTAAGEDLPAFFAAVPPQPQEH